MENITKQKTERKLTDTELNKWVKNLPGAFKKIFYENLFKNNLIWAPNLDIVEKKKRFDNYRYKGVSTPAHTTQIFIYLTALTVSPELKIQKIFPDLEQEYIAHLLPILVESSLKTNHFSYAKDQTEQLN